MKYSIVMLCYNTLPIMKRCLKAALETTGADTEIILVNQHPPYADQQEFLSKPIHPRVRVADPGRNLGVHRGIEYGFDKALGQFVIKVDDDSMVPSNNWITAMSDAITNRNLAYVALPFHAIIGKGYERVQEYGYELEYFDDGILAGVLMIKRDLWQDHFRLPNSKDRLYGQEEAHYHEVSRALGMGKAYLISHPYTHLGRTPDCDGLYGAWKLFYALGRTNEEYPVWRLSFQMTEENIQVMYDFGYPDDQIEDMRRELAT